VRIKKYKNSKATSFFGLIILLLAIALVFSWQKYNLVEQNWSQDSKNGILEVRGRKINIEKVSNLRDRQRGLSGRERLCQDCGMLFIFEKKQKASFWMKGMKFDLDMIWITDKKVSYIKKNISANDNSIFISPVVADWVLELNSGDTLKYGIEIGDQVFLE
jgi:uncharacterized protein